MARETIDHIARRLAGTFPPSLYIPIAARDADAIEDIGTIIAPLASARRAFLVLASPDPDVDVRVPVWQLTESAILRAPLQVWVDVDLAGYRRAYARAFPEDNLRDRVLDHVMNRRIARLTGFRFVRLVPIGYLWTLI